MFGTIFNYFGTHAVPCSVDLLNDAAKDYARRYYCHAENYVHMELDGNVFDGKSLPRGPAMCYLVKFIEEILGFKNSPDGKYQFGTNGQRLSKPMVKMAPLVGFNNNFQPEEYMRSLTVVQKILALGEDLEPRRREAADRPAVWDGRGSWECTRPVVVLRYGEEEEVLERTVVPHQPHV
ncbi:Hypothetical protein GSB_155340 [Giardia duodenalis]|uniref:Uncharacterized protein n=2 Tax=Giardia intestinalis TaxID=5741 RepID=C6LWF8_GIAIB|nr:Hypothetical protein GL50581_3116 [Giardia intestinalis ATCC 50581]ESU40051.1 Hypothetical protein GSB_155340 [Giardia intestinalis]